MDTHLPYQLLANVVLTLHLGVVLFVVAGLLLIIMGNLRCWGWVNSGWFRLLHLAAILMVVAETWLDITCPLTSLEMWLRAQAHEVTYSGSFIEHWLQKLLYYNLPPWLFKLAYSVFALLVVATWWYFPPTTKHRRKLNKAQDKIPR
jgi:hypothetical protein